MNTILSIEQTAAIVGCSPRTFQNKLWSDKKTALPPAHKIGRKVYFFRDEIEQWLRNQPIINAPAKRRPGRPRKNTLQN